jgi:hypothetical protein
MARSPDARGGPAASRAAPEVTSPRSTSEDRTSRVATCGWAECDACAAVVRFSERLAAGETRIAQRRRPGHHATAKSPTNAAIQLLECPLRSFGVRRR